MPRLNDGETVSLAGLEPYADVATVDAKGDAYVFLPDAEYAFTVNGRPWAAEVSGAPTVAYRVMGVRVNDEEVGRLQGEGWSYDPATSNLSLSAAGPYTLSGTNAAGAVCCRVEADAHVTLSNLCLITAAHWHTPFAIASNVAATVWFTGTNTLTAGMYCAAVEIPDVSKLVINGDGWLYAKGGTGNGWGYPGIGASAGMFSGNYTNLFVNGGNYVSLGGTTTFVSGISEPVVAGGNIFTGEDESWGYARSESAMTPDKRWASCLVVPDLEPNAPVSFSGLPDYYNTTGICANAEGKVYLYLPAVLAESDGIFFSANDKSYRAVVYNGTSASTATVVAPPTSLHVESVTVGSNSVTLVASAVPPEWLGKYHKLLRVRAAEEIPLAEGGDVIRPADVGIVTNADGTATITLPRTDAARMFYKVRTQ